MLLLLILVVVGRRLRVVRSLLGSAGDYVILPQEMDSWIVFVGARAVDKGWNEHKVCK